MPNLNQLTHQIQLAAACIPYGGDIEIDKALGQLMLLIDEARACIDGIWRENRAATLSSTTRLGSTADLLKELGL